MSKPSKHKPTKEVLRRITLITGLSADLAELTRRRFRPAIEHFSCKPQNADKRS